MVWLINVIFARFNLILYNLNFYLFINLCFKVDFTYYECVEIFQKIGLNEKHN